MDSEDLVLSEATQEELEEVLRRFPVDSPTYIEAHRYWLAHEGIVSEAGR